MYKHIMVPLDGSELAECVLPHLEMIARDCQGSPEITLIRVVTPLKLYGGFEFGGVPEYISPEQIQRLEDDTPETALDLSCRTGKTFKRPMASTLKLKLSSGWPANHDRICRKKRGRPDCHCHSRPFRYPGMVLG